MSFRPRGVWNQPETSGNQHQQPQGMPSNVGQQSNFLLTQPSQNHGEPWECPPPNYMPHATQFPSNPNMNSMPYPPPHHFAKFPPPGPPPPMLNSFSTPPPNIPPPPFVSNPPFGFDKANNDNRQHGGQQYLPTMQAYPPNVSFGGPPPPVPANNQTSFAQPTIPTSRTPCPYLQFPPPSMPVVPDSIQNKTENQTDKSVGCEKLEQWIKLNNKKQKKPEHKINQPYGNAPIQVWEFINRTKEMHELLNKLSTHVVALTAAVSTSDESTWEALKNQSDTLKEKLASGFGNIFEDDNLQKVQNKFSRIRQKRARIRRGRAARFEEKQDLQQAWEEKSKTISQWQDRLRAKIREENKEKKRKAAADRTLSKVTREIHDATRLIDTMLALEKLRLIRRDAAQKRGDSDVGESRQSFEEKIKDMTRLVKAQLECYREEEAKLKQVLKTEEEEKSKLECQDREDKARVKQVEEDKKLQQILFGPEDSVPHAHPLFPFNQYYKQATYSSSAFLQIRQEWDSFLVAKGTPASSCIPSPWVTPDPPSSSVWASALQ